MKQCVIYAISPIHAVTSLAALRMRHPQEEEVAATVVVHWPGAEPQLVAELSAIIAEMLRPQSFVRIVSLVQGQLEEILGLGRRAAVAEAVQRALGVVDADEIYYAHDVSGELYQTLCTTFPRARRICFGDALGVVYQRRVHLGHLGIKDTLQSRLYGVAQRVMSLLPDRKRRLLLEDFLPHSAALVLPVDQSGEFLRTIDLQVCARETFMGVLSECARACAPLQEYIGQLLARHGNRRKVLLLTENGAEGGFIDFARDVEMYASVIQQSCEPGTLVFLKSHPAESLPRNEAIRERLGTRFEVVELDKRFRRYPIELWRELVLASTVICMSYPVLSLKYLYDVDVIQPMDDPFIERWYPEWTWASYKNAISLYMLPLRALASWNGEGVLWAPQPRIGSG